MTGEDIKIMGDWVSDNCTRYLNGNLERRINNIVKFMGAL